MFKLLILTVVIVTAGITAAAQTETKRNTEGQRVTSYDVIKRAGKGSAVSVGPRMTYVKEGLNTEEVVRVLGKPALISEREEQGQIVTSYRYERSEGRALVVEFAKGLVISSRTEPSVSTARASRWAN
jgi:hypothetical protein